MTKLQEVASLVDDAVARLAGHANITPLQLCARLSQLSGANVYLKREDLQPVRSYKLRGAFNLMSQLSDAEREAGVVCASAGNHGQGVAWSCAALGINGKVVVPTTTPRQKRERIIALGAGRVELVVTGENYDAASGAATELASALGATLVPAFDDIRTLSGQGTIAPEIVTQLGGKAPDVVVIPVGGGGLLSGAGTWLRTNCPTTRIIAVEPAGAACVAAGVAAGEPVTLGSIDTFVDGAAVRRAGNVTLPIISALDCELMVVPEGQVCSEMLAMYQVDGVIAEPAGALASSVLRSGPNDVTLDVSAGQNVVIIVSGGNNDITRYAEVSERSLIHEGRKHYFLVTFPQEPGALRRFLDEVLGPDDDIVLFEYTKKSNRDTGPALVGLELGDPAEYANLLQRIEDSPLEVEVVPPESYLYRYLV